MSDDTRREGIATADEFEHELQRLVRAAHHNDVDVTGGWEVRADGVAAPDMDVVITVVDRELDGQD